MSLITQVDAKDALPGRTQPMGVAPTHFVSRRAMRTYPEHLQVIYFAMGCFWGVEKLFWQQEGVWVTAVGYQGGFTPNPTYAEVCSGLTGHAESVQVVFDPALVPVLRLLELFWTHHDPTQGMRQGPDTGTQYRSAIFYTDSRQAQLAQKTRDAVQQSLKTQKITTDILQAPAFYFAENEHQQYLAKNPQGYCSMTACAVDVDFSDFE